MIFGAKIQNKSDMGKFFGNYFPNSSIFFDFHPLSLLFLWDICLFISLKGLFFGRFLISCIDRILQ